MQNTFSQSGNDSKWFKKNHFQKRYVALETPPRPPPPPGKCHLKFPFWFFARLPNHHPQHHHRHRHHDHWLDVDRDQESCACDQLYWWQSCWGGTVNRYRPLPSPPFKFALRKLLIIQIMFFQILLWSQDKRLHEVNNLEASMCQ